jgi:hypothetical protein
VSKLTYRSMYSDLYQALEVTRHDTVDGWAYEVERHIGRGPRTTVQGRLTWPLELFRLPPAPVGVWPVPRTNDAHQA